MQEFGAYVHFKPDGVPFYVGKGRAERAKRLDASHHNVYHSRIVKKYGRKNIAVTFITCSSERIAFDLEIGLIKCLKRSGLCLANITDGGEGVSGVKSLTHIENLKTSLKGRLGTFKGKKHKPETIAKIRQFNLGNTYKLGKKCSVDSIEKMRSASKKHWKNIENIERQRKASQKQMKSITACGVVFESRHAFSNFTKVALSCVSRWANKGWQDKIDRAYLEIANASK